MNNQSQNLEYQFISNGWKSIDQETKENILLDNSLEKCIIRINPAITSAQVLKTIELLKMSLLSPTPLLQKNQSFLAQLRFGIDLTQDKRYSSKAKRIQLIDWVDPGKNTYEFVLHQRDKVMIDLVGYINGLPLLIVKYLSGTERIDYQWVSHGLSALSPEQFCAVAVIVLTNFNQAKIGSMQVEWHNFGDWFNLSPQKSTNQSEKILAQVSTPEYLVSIIKSFTFGDVFGVMEQKSRYKFSH